MFFKESSMNIETTSVDVGTMYEAVEVSTIPDQHNEEYVKYEVIPEVSSGDPGDLDVDSSAHPEMNKYQDE